VNPSESTARFRSSAQIGTKH